MNGKSSVSSKNDIHVKGVSYFCLLGIIRGVLERHGGSLRVHEETSTIALSLPNDKQEACYEELEGMLDTIKPFVRLLPS